MLISYYANKKSSPRLPSWQPSLIFFNIPIESGSIIKPCTLKHFQVTYRLHKAGYWTISKNTWCRDESIRHGDCSSGNVSSIIFYGSCCYMIYVNSLVYKWNKCQPNTFKMLLLEAVCMTFNSGNRICWDNGGSENAITHTLLCWLAS